MLNPRHPWNGGMAHALMRTDVLEISVYVLAANHMVRCAQGVRFNNTDFEVFASLNPEPRGVAWHGMVWYDISSRAWEATSFDLPYLQP